MLQGVRTLVTSDGDPLIPILRLVHRGAPIIRLPIRLDDLGPNRPPRDIGRRRGVGTVVCPIRIRPIPKPIRHAAIGILEDGSPRHMAYHVALDVEAAERGRRESAVGVRGDAQPNVDAAEHTELDRHVVLGGIVDGVCPVRRIFPSGRIRRKEGRERILVSDQPQPRWKCEGVAGGGIPIVVRNVRTGIDSPVLRQAESQLDNVAIAVGAGPLRDVNKGTACSQVVPDHHATFGPVIRLQEGQQLRLDRDVADHLLVDETEPVGVAEDVGPRGIDGPSVGAGVV